MRILLAEDDNYLSGAIALALRSSGYTVDQASTGPEADQAVKLTSYDLLILDLGLPVLDGLEVLKRLRGRGQSTPVLILTVRNSVADRVTGLDSGANDYLAKPFELPELEARIRALVRKDSWGNQTVIKFGLLSFDTVTREVKTGEQKLDLSGRELDMLEILLQRAGRVVTKEFLVNHLSSWEEELTFNAIEIVIYRLRKKLEASGIQIKTARGLGYLIEKTN